MAAIIYDPVQLSKKMERSGGKARIAAGQARDFIQELANRDFLDQKLSCKLTKSGDARIENCYKFNLVSGHRLVFIRKGSWFVIMFLGTHNETDNWVRNNNGIRPSISSGEVVPAVDPCREPEQHDLADDFELAHDHDRPLHEFIDQKILQDIFQGLCAQPRKAVSCSTQPA